MTGEIILADLQTEKPDRNAPNGETLAVRWRFPSMDRAADKARMLIELSIFHSSCLDFNFIRALQRQGLNG